MQKKKKKWVTPKLIVLVRGEQQEAVLTFCKNEVLAPVTVGTTQTTCWNWQAPNPCFSICTALTSS